MHQVGVGRIDRLLLRRDGSMRFRDQHVDIFSRYFYPITYIIILIIMWARLPEVNTPVRDNYPMYCRGK